MAQHLNLYDPSLRPPRVWVTPGRVALAVLLVIAAVGVAGWQMKAQAEAARQRSQSLQTQLQQLGAAAPAVVDDAATTQEIETLQRRVLALQTLAQAQATEPDGREGAAQLMQALAQAAPGDVWLSAVQWQAPRAAQPAVIALEGYMLDPRRLPVYLRRLEAQPALQGQRLAQVQVEPAPVVQGDPQQASKPAQFVLRSQTKAGVR